MGLDTCEVLPCGAVAVFGSVVGIATLGDALAGEVAFGLAAAGIALALEDVSASTDALPGRWLGIPFGTEFAFVPMDGPVLEATGASALLRPTTCVLPDAVVMLLRGCTDCDVAFRGVAFGLGVMGGKPTIFSFLKSEELPRAAVFARGIVEDEEVDVGFPLADSALSESSNGRGVRTGAEEPAIAGGEVFDNDGSLALSVPPAGRRLVPLESIAPLGGDASKVLEEFRLGVSVSDDESPRTFESRVMALELSAVSSEPENDFETACEPAFAVAIEADSMLVFFVSELAAAGFVAAVFAVAVSSSRTSTSTSLFSFRSRRVRLWNGSLGTRGSRGLLSNGASLDSTDSERLLKTFENDFKGTKRPPLDGDSRTVLEGFVRDAEGEKTLLKSPVTAPEGGGGSTKVSSWPNPVFPNPNRAIAKVARERACRSKRMVPAVPRRRGP